MGVAAAALGQNRRACMCVFVYVARARLPRLDWRSVGECGCFDAARSSERHL